MHAGSSGGQKISKNDQAMCGRERDHGCMRASVLTVNVVHAIRPGYYHETAIDKRPMIGSVEVDEHGLVGDRQIDNSHGGPDKAVYVYADEDAAYWADQLGRDIPPGVFGENLRTTGLDVTGALIGERWRVGDVLVEVRGPRTPCRNLALRMEIDDFHIRFNRSGRVGALTRVLEPGLVHAGDAITVELRPEHELTIGELARGPRPDTMQSLLDCGITVTSSLRNKAKRIAARA
jgi:MOSC domain-containing protein YiiM